MSYSRCAIGDHDDVIIDKTVMTSALEDLLASKREIDGINGSPVMCRKAVIIVFKCNECKRVRHIREINL